MQGSGLWHAFHPSNSAKKYLKKYKVLTETKKCDQGRSYGSLRGLIYLYMDFSFPQKLKFQFKNGLRNRDHGWLVEISISLQKDYSYSKERGHCLLDCPANWPNLRMENQQCSSERPGLLLAHPGCAAPILGPQHMGEVRAWLPWAGTCRPAVIR